jgi:hypothetical protein
MGSLKQREKWRRKAIRKRERRRARGLCTSCGRIRDGWQMKCKKCREEAVRNMNKRRQKYRSEGRCFRCGRPLEDERRECLRCCVVSDHARKVVGGWL